LRAERNTNNTLFLSWQIPHLHLVYRYGSESTQWEWALYRHYIRRTRMLCWK
jgi:hypothetical protein